MQSEQRTSITGHLVGALWANWAVALGGIALVLVIALFVPKLWLPLPVLAVAYFQLRFLRYLQYNRRIKCTAMVRVVMLTLFWTAIIMGAIVLSCRIWGLDNFFPRSPTNARIPYVSSLIIFPCLAIMSLWVMVNGYSQTYDTRYRVSDSIMAGNGVVSALFSREDRYQVQLMLFIGVVMSVVDWWYFFNYYFNENLNTPDRFFFNYMPIGLYLMSLFFVWSRYRNLAAVIGPVAMSARQKGVLVRYMVVAGDSILLSPNEFDRWDTPAVTYLSPMHYGDPEQARRAFAKISGIEDFEIKPFYTTSGDNIVADIEHYGVFLNEEEIPESWKDAQWFTIDKVDRLIKHAQMSPEFTDEMYRIFTITMAWKTYDRDGKRLYPIKHYRPTFRIRDLRKWAVDYSDQSWLFVAANNQDRPFFHIRKIWNKLTTPRR